MHSKQNHAELRECECDDLIFGPAGAEPPNLALQRTRPAAAPSCIMWLVLGGPVR
jgi:hypothetical protein